LLSRSFLVCVFATLAAASVAAGQAGVQPSKPLSQKEMEERVRTDAAARFRVTIDEVRVVEAGERTWPDRGLGCNARRGVLEPMPTPGFRIVVQTGKRRLTYHTDRFGRLLRCAAPTKPLDPIK
jgi:hypothetical protein